MGRKGFSSVTKKVIMAVSGAGLVLFLLFHGAMNMVSIFSEDGYRMICEFLGANWYAVVGTMGLATLMVIHIVYGFVLSYQNYRARGKQRYAVTGRQEDVSWASRNMLVLGLIVLFGIAFHLYDFWAKMQLQELKGNEPVDGIEQIKFMFSNSYISIMYLLWFVAIWFHLSHGIASMMQSIGWSNLQWKRRFEWLAKFFATLIMLMFASVVIYYWLIV